MCNRLCLSTGVDEIRGRFGLAGGKLQLRPHWNIGAGHVLPVVRWDRLLQWRRMDPMRWGLIPAWARNPMIVRTKLDVSGRFDPILNLSRRCLVPVDNFYEWRKSDKQPFAVALADRQWMALGGVWDVWMSPAGERVDCFALLTTDANALLAPLCRRMPAIIFPEDWDLWLSQDRPEAISALLGPCANSRLTIWPVDRRVGNAKNDDPGILKTLVLH
jgi:putative SOS response-associated peptidase YedK